MATRLEPLLNRDRRGARIPDASGAAPDSGSTWRSGPAPTLRPAAPHPAALVEWEGGRCEEPPPPGRAGGGAPGRSVQPGASSSRRAGTHRPRAHKAGPAGSASSAIGSARLCRRAPPGGSRLGVGRGPAPASGSCAHRTAAGGGAEGEEAECGGAEGAGAGTGRGVEEEASRRGGSN